MLCGANGDGARRSGWEALGGKYELAQDDYFGCGAVGGGNLQPLCRGPLAQSFQTYHCADGTQFIVAFYNYDTRAYLQIDGKAVTLAKRLALSGSRYSGDGVTLKITKAGNGQARQAAGDGVRTNLKKGPKRFCFDPFSVLDVAPIGSAPASAWASHQLSQVGFNVGLPAWSWLPGWRPRDTSCRAGDFVDSGGCQACLPVDLVEATSAEGRATPGRELVDLGGALIQTRIHLSFSLRRSA